MNRMSRLLYGLIVAVALALSGPGASVAGLAAAGLTPMELCGNGDAQIIWLDAQGNPVEEPLPCCAECPICSAQGPAALPGAPAAVPLRSVRGRSLPHHAGARFAPASRRHGRPEARGPPVSTPKKTGPCGIFRTLVGFASLEFGQVICARSMADRRHPAKDACR